MNETANVIDTTNLDEVPGPTPQLLIIDDTPSQRQGIERAAQQAGFDKGELTIPESWDDALAAIADQTKEFPYAVVDLDLWQYDEGGVALIALLGRLRPKCRIVALTSRRGNEGGRRAQAAGAMAFHNIKHDPAWTTPLAERLTSLREDNQHDPTPLREQQPELPAE